VPFKRHDVSYYYTFNWWQIKSTWIFSVKLALIIYPCAFIYMTYQPIKAMVSILPGSVTRAQGEGRQVTVFSDYFILEYFWIKFAVCLEIIIFSEKECVFSFIWNISICSKQPLSKFVFNIADSLHWRDFITLWAIIETHPWMIKWHAFAASPLTRAADVGLR
jgi:hypothetical protein